jgi:hypothetical protein
MAKPGVTLRVKVRGIKFRSGKENLIKAKIYYFLSKLIASNALILG